jgi:hypothetical protein
VVPAGGWWHMTVAMENSVSVSYNYIDEHGVEMAMMDVCKRASAGRKGSELALQTCQNLRVAEPDLHARTCCVVFQSSSQHKRWPRRHPLEDDLVWPEFFRTTAVEVESFDLDNVAGKIAARDTANH